MLDQGKMFRMSSTKDFFRPKRILPPNSIKCFSTKKEKHFYACTYVSFSVGYLFKLKLKTIYPRVKPTHASSSDLP